MEKIKIQKNSGDILTASDISDIVSSINEIIDIINSKVSSEGAHNDSEIEEKIVGLFSGNLTTNYSDYYLDYGNNLINFPYGLWLYSYLHSDLVNPIKKTLLNKEDYSKYLGENYVFDVSVTYECNKDYKDEYSDTPLLLDVTYDDATKRTYTVFPTNPPTKFDVFSDEKYESYLQYQVPNYWMPGVSIPKNLIYLTDAVLFKCKMTFGTDAQNTQTVEQDYSIGVRVREDRILSRLFCVIPKEMCTWDQFIQNPLMYINQICENEHNSTLLALQNEKDLQIAEELKSKIHEAELSLTSNVNDERIVRYINQQKEKYDRKKIPFHIAAGRIKLEYFLDNYPESVLVSTFGESYENNLKDIYLYDILRSYHRSCEAAEQEIGVRFTKLYLWPDEYRNSYSTQRCEGQSTEIIDGDGNKTNTFTIFPPRSMRLGDIFLLLQNSDTVTSATLGLSCIIEGRLGGIDVVSELGTIINSAGSSNWVNNIVYGNVSNSHQILENGSKKYFTIPYEDTISTYGGETYNRYGGDKYNILAFEAGNSINFLQMIY